MIKVYFYAEFFSEMKSVVSWLKKKAKCLIGKEKKKCYKLALGLVAKDNSKIIGEVGLS